MTDSPTNVTDSPTKTLVNPYWEIVRKFPNSDLSFWGRTFSPDPNPGLLKGVFREERSRSGLTARYAWAIPDDETIHWLADLLNGQGVVEIGAGSGYWAFLLAQLGVDVRCYDVTLIDAGERNTWFKADARTFHPVFRGGPEAAAKHSDRALFLCWPPYGDTMALDALRAYQGDLVIYAGELEGGCCATEEFFSVLCDGPEWSLIESRHLVQWSGMHDDMLVYRRVRYEIDESP